MINFDKFAVGLLFIGMCMGSLIRSFPSPLEFLNPSLSVVFLIVGVMFLIWR